MAENGILNLVTIDKDGCIHVASSGSVTAAEAHFLGKNPLETILGASWSANRVLIDFSRTDFIDSSAIGWLINSAREFRVRGGRLAVHSVTPRVRQMLNLLKIGQLVPLLADEQEAKRFVSEGASAPMALSA
ncbi:MAG TPA: STAS domain-containing protein [Humisphaera sp.]|nr:STAS domain-containing protein [Humisphaera sp.]